MTMAPGRLILAAMVVGALPVAAGAPGLRVKASPAVAPCVAASLAEYRRTTGQAASLEVGELGMPATAAGADLVVGADQEVGRIIESGTSAPDLDVDVAKVPWVLVAPPHTQGMELRSLGATDAVVRTLQGVVAREAWRNLDQQGLSPRRVERVRAPGSPLALGPGEVGIVPLSLAGPGPVTSLPVPPLTVRALGVRASAQAAASRRFLDFLTGEAGQAAFAACGRNQAR